MTHYELTIALFTIVYGLMLAEIFMSVHRLLRAGKKVKWHWLPILTTWYLVLVILKNWWDLAFAAEELPKITIYLFIGNAHVLIVLFLLASAVLPDKICEQNLNLKDYYFGNHRYFWGLMSTLILLLMIINFLRLISDNNQINIFPAIAQIIFFGLTILMSFSKKYWLHSVLLVVFVLMTFLEIINM